MGAALVLALLGGSSVRAESCGHYVKRLGPGFVPGKSAAEKVAADQLHAMQHETLPTDPPCGCRGPECHRAPNHPTPLTPNSPLRIPAPQEITSLAAGSDTFVLGANWLLSQTSCRLQSGFPQRLNRPPAAIL
jgi:hypothetical protein